MLMNYRVETVENSFVIIESQTEQVIRSFNTRDKAKKFLRHLNLGGAFDGWTPTFFLKKIKI
jgi:hypothetical protein